jgi:hypothetical protein
MNGRTDMISITEMKYINKLLKRAGRQPFRLDYGWDQKKRTNVFRREEK